MGMAKKCLSTFLALAMVINISPIGLLKTYAEEKDEQTLQIAEEQVKDLENEELKQEDQQIEAEAEENKSTQGTQKEIKSSQKNTSLETLKSNTTKATTQKEGEKKTAIITYDLTIKNGENGNVTRDNETVKENDLKLPLKSTLTEVSVTSDLLYRYKYESGDYMDDSIKLQISPAYRGFESVVAPKLDSNNFYFLSRIKYNNKEFGNISNINDISKIGKKTSSDIVDLEILPLEKVTATSKTTTSIQGWKPIITVTYAPNSIDMPVNISFQRASDAQYITEKIGENGTVSLLDEKVYKDKDENESTRYTVEKDGKLKFEITPDKGYKISELSSNVKILSSDEETGSKTVEVSQGDLEVTFEKIPDVFYNLNINISGKGSVTVDGQTISGNSNVQLGENKVSKVKVSPNEDYYVSSVRLDDKELQPNKDGNYYEVSINEDSNLYVEFAEKMEPQIQYSSDLTVQYDGNEKTLSYKIVGNNGEVLEEDNVKFVKVTNVPIFGEVTTTIKPKDEGSYNFTVKYEGDEKYKSHTFEDTFVIKDMRMSSKVVINEKDLSVKWDGEGKEVPYKVVGEDGTVLEEGNVQFEDNVIPTDAKKYDFTILYKGDDKYKPCNYSGTFEIIGLSTEIVIDKKDLKVIADGKGKQLPYKVVGEDGEVVYEGQISKFETYKEIFGAQISVSVNNPKDPGLYKFSVLYKGDNKKYASCELTDGEFLIRTAGKETELRIDESELTKVYNGEVQYPKAYIVDVETGEIVENAEVKVTYDTKLSIDEIQNSMLYTKGKDVGSYDFTATYDGDKTYSSDILKGTMTITKAKAKIIVSNSKKQYTGEKITTDVTITPNAGYINVYTGININLSTEVLIDLNLGDDWLSKQVKELIESNSITTVGDFKEIINKIAETPIIKDMIDVSDLQKALEYIPDDLGIKFGAPVDAGAYLSTVIVLDRNVEVGVGVGTLLIYRQDGQVVFTEDSLPDKSVVKYGDDYKFEAVYKDTDNQVKIMYGGITASGKPYFSEKQPTEVGAYIALAYSYNDPQYKAALAGRVFVISKDCAKVEITSDSDKLYDGQPYEATSVVKDSKGNVIENADVKYTYFKGAKKLDSAPSEVGKYTLVATYKGAEGYYASVDIKCITIKDSVQLIFDADNGDDLDVQNIARYEEVDYTPSTPTKEGYVFVGWYKDTDNIKSKYVNGCKYNVDTTYKAKWAHVHMGGNVKGTNTAVLGDSAGGKKSIMFTALAYTDGDKIIERGILVASQAVLGDNDLTLDTKGSAKYVMSSSIDYNKGYTYYATRINNISQQNWSKKLVACTYVKYQDKSGNEYTVYAYSPKAIVSVDDLMNK